VLLWYLLVPMRRMGTHPGCGASSSDSSQTAEYYLGRDAAHLALHSHAAHGNEEGISTRRRSCDVATAVGLKPDTFLFRDISKECLDLSF
jgi:hypothetical protein